MTVKSEKEQRILAAALQMFCEQGFHSSPTSKIAAKAGVSNGTLFHYYKNKESLIVSLYTDIKEELHNYLYQNYQQDWSIKQQMQHLYVSTLVWAQTHAQSFAYLQQFKSSPYQQQISAQEETKYSQGYLTLLANAQQQQLILQEPIEYLLTLMTSQIMGVHHYLLLQDFDQQQVKNTAENSFNLMWKMVT